MSGRARLTEGSEVTIDPAAIPRPMRPEADGDVVFGIVHVDDSVVVVDKPAGLVVHPGAGHPEGTLVNGLLHHFPDLAAVRGSGSAGHRPSPRRRQLGTAGRRPHRAGGIVADRPVRRPHRRATLRRDGVGPPGGGARHRRRPDRARPRRPRADGGRRRWAPGAHRVPGDSALPRARRSRSPRVPVADRSHPPDPRAPRRRRSSAGRRHHVRRTGARRSASGARSSMPPSCRSTIRGRASGSRSRARSLPTSPPSRRRAEPA